MSDFDEVRHGDITEVEDGVFMYPAEADTRGQTWAFEVWITLESDLASHSEMSGWHPVD